MKIRLLFLFICLHLICLSEAKAHPLKLSVANIVYKDKKFFVKLKLFTDDLEMTLRIFCNQKQIDLIHIGFDEAALNCLKKQIGQNFSLVINSKLLQLKVQKAYLNNSNEVVYVELESLPMPLAAKNKIKLKNTLMFSTIADQKNIATIAIQEVTKTVLIENTKEQTHKEIDF